MVKSKEEPFGYIYTITNKTNGKVYVGKTKDIDIRWSKHLENAEALRKVRETHPNNKIEGTHLYNSINHYGSNAFKVTQIDVAFSREELNEKERYYVKEYDSMNPDKGYNMTEGGEGGRPSPEVIEKMTKINREITQRPEYKEKMSEIMKRKWQVKEYQEKQLNASKKLSQNQEFREKMTKINTERGQDPEFRENVSKAIKAKYDEDPEYSKKQARERTERAKNPEWVKKMTEINRARAKDPEWIKKMTEINRARAKDPEWLEKMREINKQYKKEITDKGQFLKDIQNMQKKDINEKYDMDGKTVNRRIKEMLGEHGVKNYTEAKEYLKNKNVEDVSKEIEKRSAEKQGDQQLSESSVEEKEKVERTEHKEESNVEEKEKVERTEHKEESKIEEQTEGVGNEPQFESDFSPKGSMQDLIGAKVSKDKEEEAKRVPKGWDHLGPGSPTGKKDYEGVFTNSFDSSSGVNNDYEWIYEGPESKENDFEGIDEDSREKGKDSDDTDDSSGEGKTDAHYEQIDEDYAGREYGGEG